MDQIESELRYKLELVENQSRELEVSEREFQQRRTEFDEFQKIVMSHNDQLQDAQDRFNRDKEDFDRKANSVKIQGEYYQNDSEKIGFFKANKERIHEALQNMRLSLEDER